MLIPVLFRMVPQELTLEFNRKNPDLSSLYSIKTFLQFIENELTCRVRNTPCLHPSLEKAQKRKSALHAKNERIDFRDAKL